jgi:hypothetical protein
MEFRRDAKQHEASGRADDFEVLEDELLRPTQ